MSKPLVIVESPAKARTISGFLGDDYIVESSIGHIRDLPRNASDVPPAVKGEPWARLGVDVDNDFKPYYVVPSGRAKDQVKKLKSLLKGASEIYLATDEDREGESIAWHLLEVLNPTIPVKRMVFHEITPQAIERAVDEWREVNMPLVDAQETRRILDRLYGYEVSPVLWRKIMPKLSAGRVQSVATRIVVERERERMRFRSGSWWDIEGTFDKEGAAFTAGLVALDGRRLATGKDFGATGSVDADAGGVLLDEGGARALADRLAGAEFSVRSVEEKPYRRSPAAPFTTSSFQQEASRKLGMGSTRAMRAAQGLYENGYITYMRTDSTTLSETALTAARDLIRQQFGADYVPDAPRIYKKKVKNAQEAHEAIRPAGDRFRSPDSVAAEVNSDEARVYDLIWKRTVASQMKDATGSTVSVRLGGQSTSGEDAEFATSGTVITFPGYQRAYVEGTDDPEGGDDTDRRLPALTEGDPLECAGLEPQGHQTQPPARYTEASLIKRLEELGVGRPSTYASIMETIKERGYVWAKGKALVPSWLAFSVVGLLEEHFSHLVDYGFTADLENDLDAIAAKEQERVPWLNRFYFGNGSPGLKTLVSDDRLESIDPRAVNSIPIGDGPEGPIVVRVGRYGPYLTHGEDKASIAEDIAPDELTVERALEILAAPSGDRELGPDPETGLTVLVRNGRYGPYVQLGEVESGSKQKPRTASLFKTMTVETVTLDDALRLLTLPRLVGVDPADGSDIMALNGRYGPYLKKGTDSRSLTDEEQLLSITLEEALEIYSKPKERRGRGQAAPPLRELGTDPATEKPVVIKDGRFGPYITDGEVNVTVPRSEGVEEITPERAFELLADKRAKGPAPKKKKAAAKKTGAKKAAAKKTAKKKAAAKKTAS
jgi:DNA topoisomerase I